MANDAFVFESYSYQPDTHRLTLKYHYVNGPSFEETIAFEGDHRTLSPPEIHALGRLFRLIFLLCGVSYYKAFVPRQIVCAAFPLSRPTARFVQGVYRKGLAEFAYRNDLNLEDRIVFQSEASESEPPVRLSLPRRTCIPVGGGKDSIVTVETLKRAREPVVLFSLGASEPIERTMAIAGLPFVRARRALDARLFALNDAGAFNGHVPITAILSAIALAGAVIHGYDAVAMSNESSASSPNLAVGDIEVNHQYSKSYEFETELADYVEHEVAGGLSYFSFLRPLTEAAIARRFAQHPQYFSAFRSCNRAYRLDPARRQQGWCCDCPKCRFVFLALAPFVRRDELIAIFGRNMLTDADQTDGFAELCGIGAHKPFECVGEESESRALVMHLAAASAWKDDAVVVSLSDKITKSGLSTPAFSTLFDLREAHRVPARYLEMLNASQ